MYIAKVAKWIIVRNLHYYKNQCQGTKIAIFPQRTIRNEQKKKKRRSTKRRLLRRKLRYILILNLCRSYTCKIGGNLQM